jgi:hypothetical protein
MLTSAFTINRVVFVDDITAVHTDRVLADWPFDRTVDPQATARDLTLAVLARALFGLGLTGGDTPTHTAAAGILVRL